MKAKHLLALLPFPLFFASCGNPADETESATVSDAVDGDQVSIHAKFDINRKDWGVVYDGRADDLIRDEVVIEFKLVAASESTPEA